jgi:hypothetical protein
MTTTQVWPAQQAHQAVAERPTERTGGRRRYRLGTRIWTMLHAQAMLADGTGGGRYDATVIEDDRRRLAGRQAR